MAEQAYQLADLATIIKARQSTTPRSDNQGKIIKSEAGSKHHMSENDYQSIKSQYTTNYQSIANAAPVRNARSFRQDINFARNEEFPAEFIAYCVVVKESNLGIYSNERLIVLDSYLKELKYYSEIPPLPINSAQSLTTPPKETVNISTAKKFSYIPAKNGVGEVAVSWVDGVKKQWRITMSSRRIARQFGILLEQVRNNEHLIRKQPAVKRNDSSNQIENKVNKKETPFIAQIKKLEEQIRPSHDKLETKRESLRADEILNNNNEVVQPSIPLKSQHAQNLNLKQTAKQQQLKIEIPPNSPHRNSQHLKELPKVQSPIQGESQVETSIAPTTVVQVQPDLPLKAQPCKAQIKIEEIIQQAEKQHISILQINSPKTESKRFYQLEDLLKNRKKVQRNQRSSLNSHEGNRLSEKKAIIKKIEKSPPTPKNKMERISSRDSSKDQSKKKQSKYQQGYNSFRVSLLEQRRQNINAQPGQPVNLARNYPKRESVKSKSTSVGESLRNDNWLSRWLLASSKEELASIYAKFVEECTARVKKMASKFQNWHLLHKTGNQFHFQESEIDFTYFIFRQNCDISLLFNKEKDLQLKIRNWSYLLEFTKKQYSGKLIFRVPLACMIIHKGLKVFCKASLNSNKLICSLIEDVAEYITQIRQIEQTCKISLHRSELFEINLKETRFIYFNELDALPKLQGEEQRIGSNYIKRYIDQGVIRNQFDLQEITKHIKTKLLTRFVSKLNNSFLLTNIEFQELLQECGLNETFMSQIFAIGKQKNQQQAVALLTSQLTSIALHRIVRLAIHKYLLAEHKNDIQTPILSTLQLYLQGNLLLLEEITLQIRTITKEGQQFQVKDAISEYVISSTLNKLSLRCEFRYKLPFELLQNLSQDIWARMDFNAQSVNMYAISDSIGYHWHNFLRSQLLEENVFKKSISFPEGITKQKILAEINPFERGLFYETDAFKLLPKNYKTRLNYYLAHFCPPVNRNLGLSFDYEHTEIYFNLYQHSTACIQTHQSFSEDLIGIKWLIKKGKFEEADSKIEEQRQRVWIWGRHNPRLLMEIHDLESLYAQKRGHFGISTERSLTSLQLSIHFFGLKTDQSWQIIWEKAFYTADVHFQSNKLEQAASLYEICDNLSERMKGEQFSAEEINEQFLQVYSKQAVIKLTQGKVSECIQYLQTSIAKLQEWKKYFSNERLRVNILVKADSQLYEAYRLLLRCNEIRQQYQEYRSILCELLFNYFEKDWSEAYLNNPKFKFSDTAKFRFSELIKSCWIYVIRDVEAINNELLAREMTPINLKTINKHLQTIKHENHGFYRYTTQELYKFMIEFVIFKGPNVEKQSDAQQSTIVRLVIDCLSFLSSEAKHRRCKLYDQNSRSNKLLLLQSITHLIGYEFCLGLIQEWFHDYSFAF